MNAPSKKSLTPTAPHTSIAAITAFAAIALTVQVMSIAPSYAASTRLLSRRSPQAVPAQNARSAMDERTLEIDRPKRSSTHLGLMLLGNFSAANTSIEGASESDNRMANELLDRGLAPGAMLSLTTDLGDSLELDLSAGYLQRKQDLDSDRALQIAGVSGASYEGNMTSSWIQVAPLVRLKFASILSAGVGPYAAFRVGDYKIYQKLTQNGRSSEFNNSTSDAQSFDAGGVAALGARIPTGSSVELMADARYTLGLVNQSKESGDSLKFNDIQILLGISLGL